MTNQATPETAIVDNLSTENQYVDFGIHKGKLWTRIPVDYLRWICDQPLNPRFPDQAGNKSMALSELKRRNIDPNDLTVTKLSDHAIDRCVDKCVNIFNVDRRTDRAGKPIEGVCQWLRRVADEAFSEGTPDRGDPTVFYHKRMKFVITTGEIHRTLVTVMRVDAPDKTSEG